MGDGLFGTELSDSPVIPPLRFPSVFPQNVPEMSPGPYFFRPPGRTSVVPDGNAPSFLRPSVPYVYSSVRLLQPIQIPPKFKFFVDCFGLQHEH